jgi:hypothetical protein
VSFDSDSAVAQIDALLAEIEPNLRTQQTAMGAGGTKFVGGEPHRSAMKTRAAAAVARLAPPGSAYVSEAQSTQREIPSKAVVTLVGILRALRDDYEAGYLRGVEELIHADMFADFLEMAEELLRSKYKDAAAVIAGSVLEEQLRKLALRNEIATERNGRAVQASALNEGLGRAEQNRAAVYNKLTQKSVTAWLDLRNSAAHGRYGEYNASQVEGLSGEVRGFLERNPA